MGGRLRVLTANVFNGRADPAAFAALVRAQRPDVLALQELGPDLADAVAPLFPHGRLEPARDHRGMGLALVGPARLGRIALEHRDARTARLDPADWPQLERPVELLNVHIASPTARPWRAQPRRRFLQLRRLCAHLDAEPGAARVVLGDLNASPLWPVYRGFARRLDDVALRHARERGRRPEPTWCWRVGGSPVLRIDHCFASGLRAEHVQVLGVAGSDHCALVVDLAPA